MSVVDFFLLLVIAGILGSMGQAIGGYSTPGCAMSIVIGFVGAIIGRWLQHALNMPMWITVQAPGGTKFPIVWSILGAAVFVLVLRLVMGRQVVKR